MEMGERADILNPSKKHVEFDLYCTIYSHNKSSLFSCVAKRVHSAVC